MKTVDVDWSFRSPYSYLRNTRYARCAKHALPETVQIVFPEAGHASYVEYPKLFQKKWRC